MDDNIETTGWIPACVLNGSEQIWSWHCKLWSYSFEQLTSCGCPKKHRTDSDVKPGYGSFPSLNPNYFKMFLHSSAEHTINVLFVEKSVYLWSLFSRGRHHKVACPSIASLPMPRIVFMTFALRKLCEIWPVNFWVIDMFCKRVSLIQDSCDHE